MEFRVYRKDKHICNIELQKVDDEWETPYDPNIKAGDILASVADGAKYVVVENQPEGYIRPFVMCRLD